MALRGLMSRDCLAALCVALWAMLFAAGPAWGQPVRTEHTHASLIAERAAVQPGERFLVALKLDIDDDGWHVYWKNPGDSGLPATVEWSLPEGVEAGEFLWPAPHAIPVGPLMNYGYEHAFILPVEFTVPASAAPGTTLMLGGKFDWLICQEICIPDGAELKLALPVEAVSRPDDAAGVDIAVSLATAPVPLTGSAVVAREGGSYTIAAIDPDLAQAAASAADIRFFPEGHEIIHAAPQQVRRGEAGVSIRAQVSDYAPSGDAPLKGIIVATGADGSLRSWDIPAAPGAIPAGVADAAVAGSALRGVDPGAAGVLSIVLAAFLGGLVLNLMPCVLPVLSIKAAGLVHTAHNPRESRLHGLAYLGGVLACFAVIGAALIGLKMAGEQVGLGFQLQYSPVVAFFSLAMFAIGLNLLGVFEIGGSLMGVGGRLAERGGVSGAFFTGLLAAFVGAPCVGPFMAPAVGVALSQPPYVVMVVFLVIGLGLAAPFVLLSFTPAFAKILPKPGKWMATFRQALAFPMFLTAIWLLWVLAGQAGSNAVILVIAGAAVLAFGIWLANKIGASLFGRIASAAVILLAFIGPTAASALSTPLTEAGSATTIALNEEEWSPARIAELRAEGRPIFVDFTARWCVTCQVNKATSLDSGQVRKAFAETNTAFLVADWTNRDSVIAQALAEHGRAGVPLYLVYPASGGDPAVLPQILTPGLVVEAVKKAAAAG